MCSDRETKLRVNRKRCKLRNIRSLYGLNCAVTLKKNTLKGRRQMGCVMRLAAQSSNTTTSTIDLHCLVSHNCGGFPDTSVIHHVHCRGLTGATRAFLRTCSFPFSARREANTTAGMLDQEHTHNKWKRETIKCLVGTARGFLGFLLSKTPFS